MKNVILNIIIGLMLWIPVQVEAGTIQRISVNNNDEEANRTSSQPFISDNGRFIVFSSTATNLVEGDNKLAWNIFIYDLLEHNIERISKIDSDGNKIITSLYGGSTPEPSISADGRYVAFLARHKDIDTEREILSSFVHDRKIGITRRLHSGGRISANGKYMIFYTSDGFNGYLNLYELDSGKKTLIGRGGSASISGDGRFIVFEGRASNFSKIDSNSRMTDILIYDQFETSMNRVSIGSKGDDPNNHSLWPKISTNGRYVVFYSGASNLVYNDLNEKEDTFIYDLQEKITTRITLDKNDPLEYTGTSSISISGDGRYVKFITNDSNNFKIIEEAKKNKYYNSKHHTSIIHNWQTGENIFLPINRISFGADTTFSKDGRYIAFVSESPYLVEDDTNGVADIFVYDMGAGSTITISGKVNSPDNQLLTNINLCINNNCETNTNSTGNFTLTREFRNGLYLITPQTSEPLKFSPKSQWLDITDQPIENINFIATSYDPNPHIYVSTNATQFSAKRPTVDVNIRMDFAGDEPIEKNYDVYVAVGAVGASIESMLFHNKQTGFQTTLTPYAKNQRIIPTDGEWQTIFTYFFNKQVPPDDYFIHVGLMDTDNGELVAEDRVEVNYNPDPKNYYYPGMEGGVARIPTPKSELPSNPEHTITTELETYLLEKNDDDSEEAKKIAKLGADATLDLMIATLDHRGLKMFKRANGILNDISGAGIAYMDFSAAASIGEINTNQRDMLFGVYILGSLLEKASLYSVDPKDLADSIKRIFVASNEHKRTLASVATAGGVSFPTKFIFDHLGFFSFMDDEHELKVKLQALIIFADDLETPKKIMNKNNLKDMYACQFNVQSKGVKLGVMLPDPGLYLITTQDQTDISVRQQTIIIDGADVSVQFDYGKSGTNEWDYDEVEKCHY